MSVTSNAPTLIPTSAGTPITFSELRAAFKETSIGSISARELLTRKQQVIGNNGGLVAEGRDIGTAVFPDADLKIFLTASPTERAKRRALDLNKRGYEFSSIEDLEKEIKERDKKDSERKIAPLKKAQDAIELVTDGMNIEDVLKELIDIFRSKIPEEVWPTPNP